MAPPQKGQAKKRAQRLTFWVRHRRVGWGSSTRRGGVEKFVPSLESLSFLGFQGGTKGMSQEFCRDVPDPWGCSIWESEMVAANRVAAMNPPIDDTDPIRKFSIDPRSHTDLQNPAEFFPKGKPIRNFSIDPTSPIRTRLRTPFLRTPFPRLLFKKFVQTMFVLMFRPPKGADSYLARDSIYMRKDIVSVYFSVEPKVRLQGYGYNAFCSHSSRCLAVLV